MGLSPSKRTALRKSELLGLSDYKACTFNIYLFITLGVPSTPSRMGPSPLRASAPDGTLCMQVIDQHLMGEKFRTEEYLPQIVPLSYSSITIK